MLAARRYTLQHRLPTKHAGLNALLHRRCPRTLLQRALLNTSTKEQHEGAAVKDGSQQHEAAVKDGSLELTPEARAQLGFIFGNSILINFGIGAIVPCLPAFAASIGLDSAHVGLVVAIPSLARAILNLPAGHLADVLGRKRPWVAGLLVDGAGCLATAGAAGLSSMGAARFIMGGGSAVASSAENAYAMDVVARYPQHKGRIIGVMQTGGALAWVLGPVVGGLLADAGGVGVPFVLVGASLLALAPAVHWRLPETHPPTGTLQSLKVRPLLRETSRSFTTLMGDRSQRALALTTAALFVGWSCNLAVLPLYAAENWGASPGELGKLFAVASVLGIVGAPLGGYAADVFGRRPAVLAGSLTAAAAFGCVPLVESHAGLMAAMAAIGFGESFLMSATAALSNDVTPAELRGAQSALLSQVGDLTLVVMPVVLAIVATRGSYTLGFACTSGLILAANAGFAVLARPLPPPPRDV